MPSGENVTRRSVTAFSGYVIGVDFLRCRSFTVFLIQQICVRLRAWVSLCFGGFTPLARGCDVPYSAAAHLVNIEKPSGI